MLWKHVVTGRYLEKLAPKWSDGVCLGIRPQSQEIVIMDIETGRVKHARTVRRVPEEERWNMSNIDGVKVVPWNLGTDDEQADGEMPEFETKRGPASRLTGAEMEEIAA